ALRVKNLIETGVIEMPESLGISEDKINSSTKELVGIANHYAKLGNKWIEIVSDGEMSCLALSSELTKKGIENIIGIDERTTRILAERPETLGELMTNKLHQKVIVVVKDFDAFKGYRFIRSSELVYVAFKKGLIEFKDPKALEALLYATKYHGSSVSFEEIDVLKKL
ncbi:MAG: hypothetical protein Q7S74_05030, partial [Nanoarchaeota archaeon]|nr:hypothetical protein [Nanoarchaeota archaeon]